MSGNNPLGDENFNIEDLGKLLGSLSGGMGGSDPWDSAAQIAQAVAADGEPEPNVDPIERIAIESLSRVAELHVRQIDGLKLPSGSEVKAVTKSEWVTESFSAYRPFFERFGEALGTANSDLIAQESAGDPMAAMFGQMFQNLAPMMVAASAGSMIGHLSQSAFGQYDLPVPRNNSQILIVASAVDAAATEWGVSSEELRLWVIVRELVTHAVVSTPHVAATLESLFVDFASGFRPDPETISQQFGEITDLNQIQELSDSLGDPEAVLAMMRSPAQDLLVPRIGALVAAISGYVDHIVTEICATLMPSHGTIREFMRQRTIDTGPADRFMEQLLGLEVTEATLTRGEAFIAGVAERAGSEGLERLWADELDLPTAAEIDAPGLWLARIGLDPDVPGGSGIEIPDDLSGLEDTE